MKKDTNLLDAQDVRAEAATALTPNATNGEKIKALRTAQGMSMAELSRRASMSDRAIRYIEAGERGRNPEDCRCSWCHDRLLYGRCHLPEGTQR